ncbi:uncharacterized protein LOC123524830 isoform X3 [Mercenaria mercenaria]|uniref:uncharacterized protein LOC123524830 isoform X3 n=1 Tax=Mercenaria mercenaria TaxID=6596 RepID=UPI00234E3B5D|nr:uncharacterized protein LOC123524830 isoform X3 [Mercenaria mercenaria]
MGKGRDISIKDLTEDDIKQAFEKTQSKFEKIPGFKLIRITEEYYDKALQLCREHFVPQEPLMKSVGAPWCEAIESYWLAALKLNLSLMLIDEDTDEAVGFRTIRYAFKDEELDFKGTIPEPSQVLLQYLLYCEEKASFFDHYGIQETIHFLSLVVAAKYQRRGYATKIFHAAIDMVRNLGLDQVYIKGEGTSNFSKKIYEKEGFAILYEHMYKDWEVDGEKPFSNTGEHKSMKIYGRKITQS